ncbi:dihydropteroate synthase [Pantoea ananatis]
MVVNTMRWWMHSTHTNEMVNAGATITDVGGESTRPGADEVSVEEEPRAGHPRGGGNRSAL